MRELHLRSIPVMSTAMLVRRPVAEVFEAYPEHRIQLNLVADRYPQGIDH
jgi:hypothetical protein